MSVALEIPGRPVPKGRPRMGRGGRVFTPKRTAEYEERVAWYARAGGVRMAAPVELRIEAWSERPLRCDLDNVLKAVVDGLVRGGAIPDDSASVVVSKSIYSVVGGKEEKTVVHLRTQQVA